MSGFGRQLPDGIIDPERTFDQIKRNDRSDGSVRQVSRPERKLPNVPFHLLVRLQVPGMRGVKGRENQPCLITTKRGSVDEPYRPRATGFPSGSSLGYRRTDDLMLSGRIPRLDRSGGWREHTVPNPTGGKLPDLPGASNSAAMQRDALRGHGGMNGGAEGDRTLDLRIANPKPGHSLARVGI